MAQHKSALKRSRSSDRKNARNTAYKSSVRTAVKSLKNSIEKFKTGDKAITMDGIVALLKDVQSALGKAATKGLLHGNNASRSTSRLTRLVKNLEK